MFLVQRFNIKKSNGFADIEIALQQAFFACQPLFAPRVVFHAAARYILLDRRQALLICGQFQSKPCNLSNKLSDTLNVSDSLFRKGVISIEHACLSKRLPPVKQDMAGDGMKNNKRRE